MWPLHRDAAAPPAPRGARGYTLVEMILVIMIMTIVGGVTTHVILESMKVYARSMPAQNASYQARTCIERMKRELRDLQDRGSITEMSTTRFTFDDSTDASITYALAGDTLTRNGDLLARGVTAFSLTYWGVGGSVAATVEDLHLVELDLTVECGGQAFRAQSAVFPRVLGHE